MRALAKLDMLPEDDHLWYSGAVGCPRFIGWEFGDLATAPGNVLRAGLGLYLGVPSVTTVDRSLPPADSTTVVVLLASHIGGRA
jgi:hypothetical protein